ncbi:MAG: hypothetical protein CMM78_06715 [Rhodospirillaceae bacterium]|jgi:aryl-alcohol dehydrogenase-like predicted oxidoreductase|nr:hypothetical protein [Rhodospirillales bacterium]MAX47885.1 hypothetical protein [Rhodospirillaceae bacterium]|tara:strand:+ start:1820 stop:2743 length:924 start_codon:yes stop_codon:yes gene_type:complete
MHMLNSDPNLSLITLGTVQLGMPYGVANLQGQPDKETSFAVLDAACSCGIRAFDTARAYGESESIIGEWLTERPLKGTNIAPTLISKIPKLPKDFGNAAAWVIENANKSLQTLQVTHIWCFMLHNADDIENASVRKGLESLLESGKCSAIGVSVYEPDQIKNALKHFPITAVQMPGNLLDSRFKQAGAVELCNNHGVSVFCRSVFLQGVLAMPPERLPQRFMDLSPILAKLNHMAGSLNMSVLSLLMKAAFDATGATTLVLGAERPEQVIEFAQAAKTVSQLPEEYIKSLDPFIRQLPDCIRDPRQW